MYEDSTDAIKVIKLSKIFIICLAVSLHIFHELKSRFFWKSDVSSLQMIEFYRQKHLYIIDLSF
jgi:hypothetical protein